MGKVYSIYVHIPFCISKCFYCDFNSYIDMEVYVPKYIDSLIEEINCDNSFFKNDICKTIYIGGGTPSFIDSKYIIQIINALRQKYNILSDVEITIEQNPCTMSKQKLQDYISCGINRLSIGLQTTNNEILKDIGRKHTYEEFLDKYMLAKNLGFNNINVDLMIGLPLETLKDVENDLKNVITLSPNHVSVYSLILEENTVMCKKVKTGEYILPSEDIEREMYSVVCNCLKDNEYYQYEISNFSKEGMESKHNLMCWQQYEYIGFGAGACSFVGNKRFSNSYDVNEYIKDNKVNVLEEMTKVELMKEYMIIGLRLLKYFDVNRFNAKFNEDVFKVFEFELKELLEQEYIKCYNDKIELTKKGIDFNNVVCEKFV